MGEAANRYRLALAMADALKVVVFFNISSREFGQNLREVQVANCCQVELATIAVGIRRKAEAAASKPTPALTAKRLLALVSS